MEQSTRGGTPYSFSEHQRERGELFATVTEPVGWNVRELFQDNHLAPYDVWRQLRFLEFKVRIRDLIIERLDTTLSEVGDHLGFQATIELSGLLTLQDVGGATTDLRNGHRGMAGVGKTAFAVHAAHRLAASFPDGQFFLPLRAHTPGQRPVDPADALASLLLTAGLSAAQIPPGMEARAARWRGYVAGKEILLLDDAAGHEQARPLLPGTAGSLVLVTSRRRLTALEDAAVISLDTLSRGEAPTMLSRAGQRHEPKRHSITTITGAELNRSHRAPSEPAAQPSHALCAASAGPRTPTTARWASSGRHGGGFQDRSCNSADLR